MNVNTTTSGWLTVSILLKWRRKSRSVSNICRRTTLLRQNLGDRRWRFTQTLPRFQKLHCQANAWTGFTHNPSRFTAPVRGPHRLWPTGWSPAQSGPNWLRETRPVWSFGARRTAPGGRWPLLPRPCPAAGAPTDGSLSEARSSLGSDGFKERRVSGSGVFS